MTRHRGWMTGNHRGSSMQLRYSCLATLLAFAGADGARAQLNDLGQTPNAENEGIVKTLEQQVGAGRGDMNTRDSSRYIIARDPFRSIRRGRQLFQRKFTI